MPSPDATVALAQRFAPLLGAGDVLLLSGSIGAGKTHFARALIQSRLFVADLWEDVPSPTFTLVQTYQAGDLEIWHADLYRLSDAAEVEELGLQDAFETALCLVEWPDRLGAGRPAERLELLFEPLADAEHRKVTVTAHGDRWLQLAASLNELFHD